MPKSLSARRAWIEIGKNPPAPFTFDKSLSARRAWIEIPAFFAVVVVNGVALRKESVDRNLVGLAAHRLGDKSLSARRAWIEISFWCIFKLYEGVALRKESVDRNTF